jgi:hypothetical protein
MSGFTNQSPATSATGLVGQYLTELQDATEQAGTADVSSITTGIPTETTYTGSPVTLTTLVTAAIPVAKLCGPIPGLYNSSGVTPYQFTIQTNNGPATISFTGHVGTYGSSGTLGGPAIVSGTGTWTVATGARVIMNNGVGQITTDLQIGASIMRGDGSYVAFPGTTGLGVNDWGTVLANTENQLAGLTQQNTGFVFPLYNDSIYGGLQWNTSSGSGVAATSLGSPSCSAGAPLASSILHTTGATVVGDNKPFRRVIIFYLKQASGDNVTFATTGIVASSGVLSTNGSGLACWDSGDLGPSTTGIGPGGTGFTATWTSGGGAGNVYVGALYLQSPGNNGVVNFNIAKAGTSTGDWVAPTVLTQLDVFVKFMANAGFSPRRVLTADQAGNDFLFSTTTGAPPSVVQTNLTTLATNLQTTLAPTPPEVVLFAPYGLGQSGAPPVSTWGNSYVPAIRQAAINSGSTFVDGWTRFGDLSYTGDPFGLTFDNLHMGTPASSFSGRNGQQAVAELFFDKLYYSKAFTNAAGLRAQGYGTAAIVAGTPIVLSTTQDAVVFFQITTAGTFSVSIGPTSTASAVVPVLLAAAVVGSMYTVYLPAGWYIKTTVTGAVYTSQTLLK